MRKLLIFFVCAFFAFKGLAQSAPDHKALWEQIMQGVSDGSVNTSNWSLDGLGGAVLPALICLFYQAD